MIRTRVIPVLLLRGKGLVKTVKFANPKYIGDPINSVRIFNEKEVDELIFLDITATPQCRGPDFELLADIAGEAFMPMAYGGGVSTMEDIAKVFSLGFEKVVLNTAVYDQPDLLRAAIAVYGAQSIVGCIDVQTSIFGQYLLVSGSGAVKRKTLLKDHLAALTKLGVGEIMINNVSKDGTMSGYDIALIKTVTSAVSVPVIACGGASGVEDFARAVKEGGASAVAAGSLFVFMGPHRAVLINYPDRCILEAHLE